jgi:hypothetical protein
MATLAVENKTLSDNIDAEKLKIARKADEMERQHDRELSSVKARIDALNVEKAEKERQWKQAQEKSNEEYEKKSQANAIELDAALKQVTTLHEQLETRRRREENLKRLRQMIKTSTYTGIPTPTMHDFVLPKFDSISDHVKNSVTNIDEHFRHEVPKLAFRQVNIQYEITVSGFPDHHAAFKATLRRLLNLSNECTSAMDYYQRHLNRNLRSLHQAMIAVGNRTQSWRKYKEIFDRSFKEKSATYKTRFDDSIREKSRSLIGDTIDDSVNSAAQELREHTNKFLEDHDLMTEVEQLKNLALEEFIKQCVLSQTSKLHEKPRPKSIQMINTFIDRVKQTLRSDPKYIGHEVAKFRLIPDLLKQIIIYHSCFLIQLPLFESSGELLEMIEANTVTTITTSTGSGKR